MQRRTLLVIASAMLASGMAGFALAVHAEASALSTLSGRWQRPDGGYILEIRGGDASGRISATYRNPNPINVAKAEATRDSTALKVFVELRAPDYPGSTYPLTYDAKQDRLVGIYYQAVQKQTFPVYFERMK
ncbi:MAG: hypothetical protein ABI777_04095 [Betaproteobacteria bacterium]